MNFVEAIKSGFVKYATFSGRACRSEYWYWTLFTFIGGICTGIADVWIVGDAELMPVNLIFNVIVFIPSIVVSIRRLHDINRTGWWLLLWLTIVGGLVLIFWAIKAGDTGANRFGEDPLASSLIETERDQPDLHG